MSSLKQRKNYVSCARLTNEELLLDGLFTHGKNVTAAMYHCVKMALGTIVFPCFINFRP
jgi:hypothetical protein